MQEIKKIFQKILKMDIGYFYSKKDINQMYCMAELGKISPGILHDVLNPITGMLLYLDLLKKSGTDTTNSYINPVIESSNRLRDIIQIIQKDLSENAANKKVEESNLDINETIENVIKLFNHKSTRNNASIIFVRKNVGEINIQKIKLYQVFINLISNAIDSFESIPAINRQKNKVIITVNENAGFILIKISDNGCGISAENVERIFDKDYTTKKDGVGIGLNSTRNIIKNDLGGEIKYESIENIGTNCIVKIPIQKK